MQHLHNYLTTINLDKTINELICCLDQSPASEEDPSLCSGSAGIALLYAYVALSRGETFAAGEYTQKCITTIASSIQNLWRVERNWGLFGGFTGVAWAVDHLATLGFIDHDDLNHDIDDALLGLLNNHRWKTNVELISGLSGIGVYALGRRGRGQSKELIRRVIDRLAEEAEYTHEGTTWFDHPDLLHPSMRYSYGDGLYNLGVSHGVPGVIGFLSGAHQQGHARALELAEASVRWLLQQQDPHADGSYFGVGFSPQAAVRNPEGGRLCWCYGDLGIAVSLLSAAKKAGRPDWAEQAIELASGCLRRPDPFQGIKDATLCHGAFGASYIFSKFYNYTGDERFRETSRAFLQFGFSHRRVDVSCAGFPTHFVNESRGEVTQDWKPVWGLLDGITGIALILLSLKSKNLSSWDAHLLMDM